MNSPRETSILIRDIDSIAELHAAEELQKEVWGIPDIEVVPLSQLIAARASGGVLMGAFDRDTMVGFAYGFVGHERGRTTHHSHMLAVKTEYRSHDLGFRLKAAQREKVLAQGIGLMTWTFDPLQSLNAYFNFGKLGVISDQYYVDFYGQEAASFLHRNSTDRLWVTWPLASSRVEDRLKKRSAGDPPEAPLLVELDDQGRPLLNDLKDILSGERAAIEIPADINSFEPELAAEWRRATREAFTEALGAGMIVEDFYRVKHGTPYRGAYFLSKKELLPGHKPETEQESSS